MADETKVESVTTDDITQKVETPVGESPKVETKVDIDNAVFAALRKKDIEAAKRLLEVDKPAVDLSNYVEKAKYDELFKRMENMATEYQEDKKNTQLEKVVAKYNLKQEDVELIATDDLELFEKRAAALANRVDKTARQAASSTSIPTGLENSDLAKRLFK